MTIHHAFRNTDCTDCAALIEEGDPIYFSDDGKLCSDCATRDLLVCPHCHSQKKPQFASCFNCSSASTGGSRSDVAKRKFRTNGGK